MKDIEYERLKNNEEFVEEKTVSEGGKEDN